MLCVVVFSDPIFDLRNDDDKQARKNKIKSLYMNSVPRNGGSDQFWSPRNNVVTVHHTFDL